MQLQAGNGRKLFQLTWNKQKHTLLHVNGNCTDILFTALLLPWPYASPHCYSSSCSWLRIALQAFNCFLRCGAFLPSAPRRWGSQHPRTWSTNKRKSSPFCAAAHRQLIFRCRHSKTPRLIHHQVSTLDTLLGPTRGSKISVTRPPTDAAQQAGEQRPQGQRDRSLKFRNRTHPQV
jgi:hypothetical protein